MNEKTQRIVIWVITFFFIVSTFGVVVYYILANKQQQEAQIAFQQALEEQQNSQQQTAQDQNSSSIQQAGKLTGTKLLNFDPLGSIKTLQSQDIVSGVGNAVKAGDKVTVKYVGAFAKDGIIFDASSDHGQDFSFTVGNGEVIKGWDVGVPGMKTGGKRRLIIPASLAYGDTDRRTIPANSDLVFDIEVIKIES